jgi:hypothetical protein
MKKRFSLPENDQLFIISGFILLALFSIVFAKERIINSDAAFYLFKLINFEHFNIEHGRYSAFISQLIILTSIKAGMGVKLLIVIYSLSFIILFFIVFLLLKNILKNKAAGLTVLLLITAGISHINYRPVSESTQGLIYSLILFGILYLRKNNEYINLFKHLLYTFLSLMVIILCHFSHPITIFPILFILGYYLLDTKSFKDFFPYLLLILVLVIFSFKFFTQTNSSYEEDKLSNIKSMLSHLKNFLQLYPTKFIIKRLYSVYFIPLILWSLLMLKYIKTKSFQKLIYVNVFLFGFIIVHNLIYFAGASDIEHEKNLMTANFFIFLPFSFDYFYDKQNPKIKSVLLFFVLLFSGFIILKPAHVFKNRIAYLSKLSHNLSEREGSKFYTLDSGLDQDRTGFLWSVPVETLLLSSTKGPDHSKTIYSFPKHEDIPEYITEPNLFLCAHFWKKWNLSALNKKYFRLSEEPYIYIPPESLKIENK